MTIIDEPVKDYGPGVIAKNREAAMWNLKFTGNQNYQLCRIVQTIEPNTYYPIPEYDN